MKFFHVSITLVALEHFFWRLVENQKNEEFNKFLEKKTRIDLQGPMVLEPHQDVKTRHLVCIFGEKSNIRHLYTFDSLSSLIRQNENLKFLEKSAFFNEENTNEFDPMVKSGKIHFFSIWAVTTSFWATKVVDTPKNCIFSQLSMVFKTPHPIEG